MRHGLFKNNRVVIHAYKLCDVRASVPNYLVAICKLAMCIKQLINNGAISDGLNIHHHRIRTDIDVHCFTHSEKGRKEFFIHYNPVSIFLLSK